MVGFHRKSVEAFSQALASESGAPGGGAAAALTGALGVALLEMTTRINDRRRKERSLKALARTAALRKKLLSLIDRDAAVFGVIEKLYKKKERGALWQKALKSGAGVPLEMTQVLAMAAPMVVAQKPRTGAWLISDLKEAALLIEASFRAARMNVEINLVAIQDKRFVGACRTLLRERENAIASACRQIGGVL